MLESVYIKNFVLIPELNLDLRRGLTCLTGETGSGKSIILGALSLLLGGKADKESIRGGEESAEISGVFTTTRPSVKAWLEEKGLGGEDGRIIIRRTMKRSGRSHYSINGMNLTVGEGTELGHLLVDVTSQHSNQSLTNPETQLLLLDQAAGDEKEKERYQKVYLELLELEKEKSVLEHKIMKANEDRDYNEYCRDELEKAELRAGEDDELKSELDLVSSMEFLVENLSLCSSRLSEGAKALDDALTSLGKCQRKDERLNEHYSRLESLSIDAEDLAETLSDHLSSYSFDPYEIEEKNQRLAYLQRIKKKYGGSIESAIERLEGLRESNDLSEEAEIRLSRIEKAIKEKKDEVLDDAAKLHAKRVREAKSLEKRITESLERLVMKGARFEIRVELSELTMNGQDLVSFMIAPNKGEKMTRLEDTASGGELSRVMLAIKSCISGKEDTETLIFDEIDTGIGGSTANNVAEELHNLSKKHQIVAITHLAQIASRADQHLVVSKAYKNGRTVSSLTEVKDEDRVREVARLLSGEESEVSLEHAKSLLDE